METSSNRNGAARAGAGLFGWRRKAARLAAEFANGGWRKVAAFLATYALSRMFAPWLVVESRCCMRMAWDEALALMARAPQDERVRARRLSAEELDEYAKNPDYRISAFFLRKLRVRHDACIGVFVEGVLAAYSFISFAPTPVDDAFEFSFPRGWVYIYKSFTHPTWRGRGLHGHGLIGAIRYLASPALAPRSNRPAYQGLVALVASDNDASLRSFGRLGFRATRVFRSVSVLAWRFCPGSAAQGFEIRAA